jgi:hypothetical protein
MLGFPTPLLLGLYAHVSKITIYFSRRGDEGRCNFNRDGITILMDFQYERAEYIPWEFRKEKIIVFKRISRLFSLHLYSLDY